jgi:hypothetical protein
MTRDELHEIDARCRGDADIRVLLLEIKRLRDVLVRATELAGALMSTEGLNGTYTHERLIECGEEPAVIEPPRAAYGKPKREPPTENEGERAAKRRAREERG